MLISTADSYLHAASVLFANDIWFRENGTTQYPKSSLMAGRTAAVVIGIISLVIALYMSNAIRPLNMMVHIYGLCITIPFIVSCLGFRPRAAALLLTMAMNIFIVWYLIYYKNQTITDFATEHRVFASLILSALIFFTAYYLLPSRPNTGWVGIPDDSPVRLQNQETKRWWLRKIKDLQAIFTISYWSNIFPKHTFTFIILGIYSIAYGSISLFYMQRSYVLPYIYWYMAIMTIGTLITLYPSLHSYRKYNTPVALYLAWPLLLYMVLFVSAIGFIKLSHFASIVCALFIVNIGVSILLLPSAVIMAMLGTVWFIDRYLPPMLPIGISQIKIDTALVVGIAVLLSCLVIRYIRNQFHLMYKIMHLEKEYTKYATLASIHNQANWNRLDPTYSGKILQEIAETIKTENLEEQKQKLHSFSRLLLQRAKEERKLTLAARDLKEVDISSIIFKAHETVRDLDKPLRLLVKYETKISNILTDRTLFERLLIINFFEICQCKKVMDHIVTLVISDTSLHYCSVKNSLSVCNNTKQITPLTLPALAFCITTDKPIILPMYVVPLKKVWLLIYLKIQAAYTKQKVDKLYRHMEVIPL